LVSSYQEIESKTDVISILNTETNEEVRVVRTGLGHKDDFVYSTTSEFDSRFSGNGIENANWSQEVELLNYS
jgi:hypothetical protein